MPGPSRSCQKLASRSLHGMHMLVLEAVLAAWHVLIPLGMCHFDLSNVYQS